MQMVNLQVWGRGEKEPLFYRLVFIYVIENKSNSMHHIYMFVTITVSLFSLDYHYLTLLVSAVTVLLEKA